MHFRTKREYLKIQFNETEKISKSRNTGVFQRSISEVKKCYQPRANLIKYENFNLLAHSHGILNWWKNHLCQLFNLHVVHVGRQTEIQTSEPLVPHSNVSEVKMTVEKEKINRTQVLIKFQGNYLKQDLRNYSLVHKLILFQIRKICLHKGKVLKQTIYYRSV
jgi:hypothetical protein